MNPHDITKQFETALCAYTGAKYAVTCTSCTSALLMALMYELPDSGGLEICIPKRTYVGVAQSILSAGAIVGFRNEEWSGGYQLEPLRIWDYARRMTSGMFVACQMQAISMHPTKILGLSGYGGAILHDDDEADDWLRRVRFDGRKEGVPPTVDEFTSPALHCYMSPVTAAEGLLRLSTLPRDNADLPNDDYPDLSLQEIFK